MEVRRRRCRRCRERLPVSVFVDTEERPNPRGIMCAECRRAANYEATVKGFYGALQRGIEYLRYASVKYGSGWFWRVPPCNVEFLFRHERPDCPYCGRPWPVGVAVPERPEALGEAMPPFRAPWSPVFRESDPSRFQLDHMDPLDLGGSDSLGNAVYCCTPCNLRKGRRPFLAWLEKLPAERHALARELYDARHGHPPEAFVPDPNEPTPRSVGFVFLLQDFDSGPPYHPDLS